LCGNTYHRIAGPGAIDIATTRGHTEAAGEAAQSTNPGSRSREGDVKVRVGFKVKDPRIVPEMGTHVSCLESAPQGLSGSKPAPSGVIVPPEAIQACGETGTAFVIVGDRLERRSVKLGARTSHGQMILSGIHPGTALAAGQLEKWQYKLRAHVVHQNLLQREQ